MDQPTKRDQLTELAQEELKQDRLRHEGAIQAWRDQVAKSDSSPTYLIRAFAEGLFHSEEMLRWHEGITYSLSDEGAGLEDLLEELEECCDRWSPTNSTCLLERLRGDVELRTLREARKLVERVLRAQAASRAS